MFKNNSYAFYTHIILIIFLSFQNSFSKDTNNENKLIQEQLIAESGDSLKQDDSNNYTPQTFFNEIKYMPILNLEDIMMIQPGISYYPDDAFQTLGGLSGEIIYSIDDIPIMDAYTQSSGLYVDLPSIKHLSVSPGLSPFDWHNNAPGSVNITTDEGSDVFAAHITTYLSDYTSNSDLYNVTKSVHAYQDPESGEMVGVAEEENSLAPIDLNKNIEFHMGGPILSGPYNKLNFFLSGRYLSNNGYL